MCTPMSLRTCRECFRALRQDRLQSPQDSLRDVKQHDCVGTREDPRQNHQIAQSSNDAKKQANINEQRFFGTHILPVPAPWLARLVHPCGNKTRPRCAQRWDATRRIEVSNCAFKGDEIGATIFLFLCNSTRVGLQKDAHERYPRFWVV